MEATREYQKVGDRIYYTGDMANDSAWCMVSEVHADSLNQPVYVALLPDGEDKRWTIHVHQIGNVYKGHCDPRFVTKAAYDRYYHDGYDSGIEVTEE